MSRDLNEVKRIFLEAISKPDPGQRRAAIDAACGGDEDLRECVLAMLEAHECYATPVPEMPTASEAIPGSPSPAQLSSGTVIGGRYRIIELINDGGMGSVYRATRIADVRLEVALKVIKPGLDSQQVLARFNIERQALAMMNHENIARVFDAGMTEYGRPYFVMELVKGLPLTRFCDENKLSVSERLELFIKICSAVQHAHQKGIIHRDLKPTNILVGLYDSKAVPKVIDFGLAKAIHQPITDDSLHTRMNTFVGTRRYVAPEQALLNNLDIDTRADVYSLGVILYELLTGKTPLDNDQLERAAQDEVQRMIREIEPPKPSDKIRSSEQLPSIAALRGIEPVKLEKLVRGELDWVVMRALEKDRDRRYGSASDLAADVTRYVKGEPVEAGPPTIRYRLSKIVRKHRGKVLAAGVVAVSLSIGAIISTAGWLKANQEKHRADEQALLAKRQTAIAKSVNQFVTDDLLSEADPTVQVRPGQEFISNLTVKRALDRAADKVGTRFENEPLYEAAVRQTIGRTYVGLGDYKAARMHFERAEALRRQESGSDDPDRLSSLLDLGSALLWARETIRAEPVLLEAKELLVQKLGPGNSEACRAKFAVALLLEQQGKLDEAKAMMQDVLGNREKTLGVRGRETLAAKRQLARIVQAQGQYQQAEKMLIDVLDAQKDLLSEMNPETLTTRNNLAALYSEWGQLDKAEQMLREVEKTSETMFGKDDRRYLTYCNNHAATLLRLQRYDEAMEIYQRILPALKQELGLSAYETLAAMLNYAGVLAGKGEFGKAEPLLLDAYRGCCQNEALGESSIKTKDVIESIIELYSRMQRPEKVKEWTTILKNQENAAQKSK